MSLFVPLAALMALCVCAAIAIPLLRTTGSAVPAAPWTALASSALLLVGATVLYVSWSNWTWPAPPAADSPQQMVATLAHRLEQRPDDLDGWLLLGRSYAVLEQYPLALRAYERANRLAAGNNVEALLGVAEILALQNEAEIDGRAGQLFERALSLDPSSGKALFYGAVVASRRGDLGVARDRFARLLALNPPENIRPMIEQQIRAIDDRLAGRAPPQEGASGAAMAAAAPATPAARAAPATAGAPADLATPAPRPGGQDDAVVKVNVRLSPGLRAEVGDSPLFVLVRDPAAPGPPLAAKRLESRFPQSVELTPRDSMIPGHSFHNGQNVEVVARISRSGAPIAQTGDPFGALRYAVGTDGVREVVIDRLSP
jgi:cytochrome c-type biogenesis protein CcmH